MAYYKLTKIKEKNKGKNINESKKKYKYLYKKATEMETIKAAYKKMRKGKTNRAGIKRIDANFEKYCAKMQRMLENTKPPGVPVEHPELAFNPKKHEKHEIREKKKREIEKPSLTEQWVHHIIIIVLKPIFMNRLYGYSLGSIPKRVYGEHCEKHGGAHKGKKKLEMWVHGGFKFFLKMDVRHFYDSIRVPLLLKELSEYICDDWMMHLIAVCLQHMKKGLSLGFYIVQWSANMFVVKIDRLIIRAGFRHIRYMDDIVVVGDNKRALHGLVVEIRKALGALRLRMKGDWQVCRFDYIKRDGKRVGRPIDFMGFKFYRDRTVLRKHIIRGMARVARHIAGRKAQGKKVCCHQASSIVSRVGWIRHTDCYGWYLRNVKSLVEIRQMKGIVSKHNKKTRKDRAGHAQGRMVAA